MRNLIKTTIAIAMFFCANLLSAQEQTITGKILDTNGLPLPGANILIKGTTKGIQSDFDGLYFIDAQPGDVLVVSFIGFATRQITISDKTEIDIILQNDVNGLDQVILIGYGSVAKKTLTASISSVQADDIDNIPAPSLQSSLISKVSGVQITQLSGKVEAGVKVRVRGISTIASSQEPLYVVDGVIIINDDESINNSPINPLIGINPADIESIDFLKDASSAAIYGARGTNGVIIITTKQGKAGKTKVSFSNATGWSQSTRRKELLNAKQYVELYREAAINGASFDDTITAEQAITQLETDFDAYALGKDWRNGEVDTNWQNLALIDGATQDINLAASGGSEDVKYYLSTSYNKTEGIILGNELDRYTLRGKVDTDLSEKTKIGFNANISKVTIDRLSNDNSFSSPLQSIAQSPLTPALLDDGTANADENSLLYTNFLGQDQTGRFVTDIWRTTANIYGEYFIIPSLKYRSEIGYDANNQNVERFSGSLTEFGSVNGQGTVSNAITERYLLTNYVNYDETFFGGQVDFKMTLGGSFEETTRKSQFTIGQGFPSDNLQTLQNATFIVGGSSNKTKYNFLSYFARSRFDIKNRYLFNFSIRRDGSSRFGKNVRTGWFPAASAAWIITNENFLNDSYTLSKLRLRGSWGITGNAEIGNFSSRSSFGVTNYNGRLGFVPTAVGDPSLQWERTNQFDFGLDFGLLNNAISGELDYYRKETEKLLINKLVPGTNGFSTVTTNEGTMINQGYEATLRARIFGKSKFTWNTAAVFSFNENEITSLPNDNQDDIQGVNILRKGEALSSFYLYEYAGVDPANGDALFFVNSENADGSLNKTTTNSIEKANRILTGNPFPDIKAGFTNTITYGGLDFEFTLQGEWGASIYNQAGRFQSGNTLFPDNQTIDQLDRWQNPGDITDVPQARLGIENGQQESTRYLQSADFIRLRNVTLGYTINSDFTKKFYMQKVRFYFSGLNLYTFTDYEGYDPESTADFNGNSGVRTGIAFYSAPPAKTYTLGVNIEF